MNPLFYLSLLPLVIFSIFLLSKTKRVYERGEALPPALSLGWWILDVSYSTLVILSSAYHLWELPLNEKVSFAGGLLILILGVFLTSLGIREFRSIRRISGMEISLSS